MTGTELATAGTLALRADQSEWTEPQKAALAQLGIADASRGDQLVFLHVAQRMGLDPFNKEIYMISRWDPAAQKNKWTIQIGIDGFRSKSEEHPEYAGIDGPEWCGTDGVWRDVWLFDEPPVAARFTVYRKDWQHPIRAVAHYREYVQLKKDGKPTATWTNRPAGQLGKCSEALARRKAFPRRLTGVYLEEELQHLDNPQPPPVVIESERVTEQPPDWDTLLVDAMDTATHTESLAKLKEVWDMAKGMFPNDRELLNKISAAVHQVRNSVENTAHSEPDPEPAPADSDNDDLDSRRKKLFALLRDGGIHSNAAYRARRLKLVNRVLVIENRPPTEPITSFDQLTAPDFDAINGFLTDHKFAGDLEHTCAELSTEPTQ